MTRKPLLLLAALLFATLTGGAQSISRQINDIKRSNDYVSAEAMSVTEAQAYELAEELLTREIEQYVDEQKALKQAPNIIVKDVAHQAEKLQMQRGEMVRIFLYVKKSDIIAARNTRILVQPSNSQPASVPGSSMPAGAQPVSVAGGSPAGTAASNDTLSLRLLSPVQQSVCDQLLSCQSLGEVIEQMSRLRTERKVKRYGSPAQGTTPEKYFWVIIRHDGPVATILAPNQGEGYTNLRTLRHNRLSDFDGMDAVWFTTSK